ncbi:hypothetical protein ACFX13_033203 [Malus domestica]
MCLGLRHNNYSFGLGIDLFLKFLDRDRQISSLLIVHLHRLKAHDKSLVQQRPTSFHYPLSQVEILPFAPSLYSMPPLFSFSFVLMQCRWVGVHYIIDSFHTSILYTILHTSLIGKPRSHSCCTSVPSFPQSNSHRSWRFGVPKL